MKNFEFLFLSLYFHNNIELKVSKLILNFLFDWFINFCISKLKIYKKGIFTKQKIS